MEAQRHIKLTKKHCCTFAIVVGSPERVDTIKALCDSYVDLFFHREYKSVECHYKGVKFLCVSHGIGSAGSAICIEELISIGVKIIIRVGTCGSLQPREIKIGDICIPFAAVREDKLSHILVPADYPAVGDFEVYDALLKSADELKEPIFTGICVTSDLYYKHQIIPHNFGIYSKANAIINDMELGTLMIIGSLRKVKLGGILLVDGCPLEWTEGNFEPNLDPTRMEKMIKIALNSVVRLAAKYK